jgi:hypothetical protein
MSREIIEPHGHSEPRECRHDVVDKRGRLGRREAQGRKEEGCGVSRGEAQGVRARVCVRCVVLVGPFFVWQTRGSHADAGNKFIFMQ